MFCKNCGAKIPDDVEFCGKCGHPIDEAATPPKKVKKRTGLIVAVVILSVLLAISLIFMAFMFLILPAIQEAIGQQIGGIVENVDKQADSLNENKGELTPSINMPEDQEGEMTDSDVIVVTVDADFLIGNWRETDLQIDPWGHVDEEGMEFAEEQIDDVESYKGTYENYASRLVFYEDGTFLTIQYENEEPFAYRWYWWDISDSSELFVGTGDEFPMSETPNWSPSQLDLMQDFQDGDYSEFVGSPYWLVRIERHNEKLYWYLPSTNPESSQEVVCSVVERDLN